MVFIFLLEHIRVELRLFNIRVQEYCCLEIGTPTYTVALAIIHIQIYLIKILDLPEFE